MSSSSHITSELNSATVKHNSTPEELIKQLREILTSSVPSRRAFVCHGHIPVRPTISLPSRENKPIALERAVSEEHDPSVGDARLYRTLQPSEIFELRNVAHPAQFGRGPDTLIDNEVRSGLELIPEEIMIDHLTSLEAPEQYRDWFKLLSTSQMSPLLETIRKQLAPLTPVIRALPYKVNLYSSGDHFVEHLDAPIAADHFGTLLIFLPSPYTGGELTVEHSGLCEKFQFGDVVEGEADISRTVVGCDYVAFYTDCKHKVEPVLSGHRVTLAYTLHMGAADQERKWLKREKALAIAHQQHIYIPRMKVPDGAALMSYVYDLGESTDLPAAAFQSSSSSSSAPQPICSIGPSKSTKDSRSSKGASATSSSSALPPSIKSEPNLPHAPAVDEYLEIPGDARRVRELLNQKTTATYCLPSAVVDMIVGYVSELSVLHELFRHPAREFDQLAFVLAHGYPYVTIARAAAEHESYESGRRIQGQNGEVTLAGATTFTSESSSALELLSDVSASEECKSSSPLNQSEPLLRSTSIPAVTATGSPPSSFFLKGRDRDVADALIEACAGSNLHVRIAPIQVRIDANLHRGEWTPTTIPGEMQMLAKEDPLKGGYYDHGPPKFCVNEILSFNIGGTIEQVCPLDAPGTLFLNDWKRMILTERAVSSQHQPDWDPRGTGEDDLHHHKLAEFFGSWSQEGGNVGNGGYKDEIELQYISAAIVIEEIDQRDLPS